MNIDIAREIARDGLCRIFVWKLGVFPRKIRADSALRSGLGLDDVDMGDLGAAMMKEFKMDSAETARALASCPDVESLADFIAERLRGGS